MGVSAEGYTFIRMPVSVTEDVEVDVSMLLRSIVEIPGLPEDAVPLEMVKIPAGTFMMGSDVLGPDALPRESHEVTITRDFFMGKYPVTQAQWETVMGYNPSYYRGGPNNPVEQVSWYDCQEFIHALNEMDLVSGVFRLPTEAEWEYALGAQTDWHPYVDHYYLSRWRGPGPPEVGKSLPNPWGLCDMIYHVYQWCYDWYGDYPSGPVVDPIGPVSGLYRVYRGGSFGRGTRATDRFAGPPRDSTGEILGFRLVLSQTPLPPMPTFTPTPTPLPGNAYGVIYDAHTLDPIEGAVVTISDVSTTTDETGFYFLSRVPGADRVINASAVGYIPAYRALSISNDVETNIPMAHGYAESMTVDIPGLPDGCIPLEMVRIPAGTFMMGSPENEEGRGDDEGPQHQVTISRDFYIGMFEVTRAQYHAVMGTNPSYYTDKPNNPVGFFFGEDYAGFNVFLSGPRWYDCVRFCNALSRTNGLTPVYEDVYYKSSEEADWNANGFRLPTEAEWEYACRAGTTTRFYWGDSDSEDVMKQYCWYRKNAMEQFWTDPHAEEGGTQPVGTKLPNYWGMYDMIGNVYEWCYDWYSDYPLGPVVDPTGPRRGSERVVRGNNFGSHAFSCRSANRTAIPHPFIAGGFRVVLSPTP
ncbi:MAG: SUMF1/EgtB/PvdO family nonheme iron enzyme [Candidatus Thorarchaeota archaeon]